MELDPLNLSEDLTKFAQEWADHLAQTDSFEHRPDNKYGENIMYGFSAWPEMVSF